MSRKHRGFGSTGGFIAPTKPFCVEPERKERRMEHGQPVGEEMTVEDARGLIQGRKDVITLAESVRQGKQSIKVTALSNGFMVELASTEFPMSEPQTFVFKKVNEVGTLMHRLMNGNLENAEVIKSLRRLLGYL